MVDVLDLYAEAPDHKQPVVCFDESPVQLIGEVRQPMYARPGQFERYDYEYRRNDTGSLFVLLDVHRPLPKVKVIERRAAEDYARCMRDLIDIHYPDAEIIRVVQDNLSIHSAGARIDRDRDRRPNLSVPGVAGSTTPNDYAARSKPGRKSNFAQRSI
jgi:hypothetical protein